MSRAIHSRRAELLEVLEVLGFDLLAQVEAMLRHTRAYQREVQRLRGMAGHSRTATSTPSSEALHQHVARLQTAGSTFRDTIKAIKEAAAMPVRENVPRRGDASVAVRGAGRVRRRRRTPDR
jgi:hypothetical protein